MSDKHCMQDTKVYASIVFYLQPQKGPLEAKDCMESHFSQWIPEIFLLLRLKLLTNFISK